jgi:hypothetical protein
VLLGRERGNVECTYDERGRTRKREKERMREREGEREREREREGAAEDWAAVWSE